MSRSGVNEGPIAVRWQRTPYALIPSDVLGTRSFPLLRSATGNVFLSYLPDRLTEPLVATELQKEARARDRQWNSTSRRSPARCASRAMP